MRVDAGVADGSVVEPHYDPMLAKVIAHGATRAEAARRLAGALRTARIHGVTTNRDLLLAILGDADFLAGRYVRLAPLVRVEPSDPLRAAAAALAESVAHRRSARVLGSLPAGWRNVPAHPQRVAYTAGTRRRRSRTGSVGTASTSRSTGSRSPPRWCRPRRTGSCSTSTACAARTTST